MLLTFKFTPNNPDLEAGVGLGIFYFFFSFNFCFTATHEISVEFTNFSEGKPA